MFVSNRSGILCRQHPNEQYTNYCTSLNCLKPLCPDCVEIHTKLHDKQEIQSWKHCLTKQKNTISATMNTLKKIQDQQKKYQPYKSQQQIQEENVRILLNMKQKVHKIVQEIFLNYEQHLRSFIRKNYKVDLPDTTKLKLAIQQMRKLYDKLQSTGGTILQGLKKSLQLDHQSLLKFFEELNYKKRETINQTFFIENHQLYTKIKGALESSLSVSKLKENPQGKKFTASTPIYNKNNSFESDTRNIFQPLKITMENYFNENTRFKCLHFFIPESNELRILDIQNAQRSKIQWKALNFAGKGKLPCYFKSIVTPQGNIYLTGGSQHGKRSSDIYQYNFEKNTLDLVCKMKFQRSSHSICYANGLIYLIGGFSNSQGDDVTRNCEVFNPKQRKCYQIAPLNAPSANSCAVSFHNEYIFKFGGVQNKTQGNNLIQMYSIKKNKWIVVDIESDKSVPELELLSFSAAVQINPSELMVFGGYDNSQIQKPERLCYTLQVNVNKGTVKVKNYNTTPLPYAQGFWNNNPIIHNSKVYALQNINDPQDEQTAIADENRVIMFDGDRWY